MRYEFIELLDLKVFMPQGAGLSPVEQDKAMRMIHLVGLDKNPGNDPAASDRHWQNRLDAWGMAKRAFEHVQRPYDEMRSQVVDTAVAKGYWTIWMTVFAQDSAMRLLLIQAFKGTSATCFDPHTAPVPRPGGEL
jgi:hypothetical protein